MLLAALALAQPDMRGLSGKKMSFRVLVEHGASHFWTPVPSRIQRELFRAFLALPQRGMRSREP
jgi:hypothetical protein